MVLRDVLDKEIIKIGLDAKDKDDALRQLAQLLLEKGYISDLEGFVKDIYFRESEGVTGLGNGIAIPHGQSTCVNKLGIAIATCNKPIEWESLDDEPVDTIFLFCVSAGNDFSRDHMLLLSKVAARLADDDLLVKIRNASNSEEMINLLSGE